MVILIALAAVVALVSWLTRSARRRRKNCLEALTFKTDISDEDLAKMDSHPFEGTDMREALDHAQSGRTPITPFYIEPNSAIFTHENYPQDAEIHDRLRVHQGAYLPSFVPDDTTSYRLHRNGISFGDRALSQPGSRQTTTAKAHPDPWLHEPNFLLHDDPSVPKTSSRATNEIDIVRKNASSLKWKMLTSLRLCQSPASHALSMAHQTYHPQMRNLASCDHRREVDYLGPTHFDQTSYPFWMLSGMPLGHPIPNRHL
jgi:hypothetical protein